MNAGPLLVEIARHLQELHFDVVLIGNAAAALRRESDRALVEMLRARLVLPPEKRTHFLRKRVVFRGSAL